MRCFRSDFCMGRIRVRGVFLDFGLGDGADSGVMYRDGSRVWGGW